MTVVQAQLTVVVVLLGMICGALFFVSTQITHFETRVILTLDRISAVEQGLQAK